SGPRREVRRPGRQRIGRRGWRRRAARLVRQQGGQRDRAEAAGDTFEGVAAREEGGHWRPPSVQACSEEQADTEQARRTALRANSPGQCWSALERVSSVPACSSEQAVSDQSRYKTSLRTSKV